MPSLGEDLRTCLVGSTLIAATSTRWSVARLANTDGVVEQNTIRENAPRPRIWFQRDSEHEISDLEADCQAGGLIESRWAVEVHTDVDEERYAIADAIKRRMATICHSAMGSRTVQAALVEDQDDDYYPRGLANEDELFVAALEVTIYYAST